MSVARLHNDEQLVRHWSREVSKAAANYERRWTWAALKRVDLTLPPGSPRSGIFSGEPQSLEPATKSKCTARRSVGICSRGKGTRGGRRTR